MISSPPLALPPTVSDDAPALVLSRVEGDDLVVEVAGEIDLALVAAWDDATLGLPAGDRRLVLDTSAVTFIDAAGVGLLVRLRRAHPDLLLRGPSATVVRLLEMTGSTSLLASR